MKLNSFTKLLATSAIALGGFSLVSQPSQAQSTTFYCGMSNGVPTTFANTPRGNVPVIRWVSGYFSGSGYTPEVRCQEVTSRFQNYYNQGILNYITSGYMNGQPVICVSGTNGGECSGLLFTLKPGENASRKLQQLFDIRQGASGPLYESSNSGSSRKVYIDVNNYLETTPVENSEVTTPNSPTEPTTPNNQTPPVNNPDGGIW